MREDSKQVRFKFKGSPFAKILPSCVTLLALASGVSSIQTAANGYYSMSIYLVFLAAIFDGLDGHVARVLHAATEFGAELDSLCDLVDFGVSPALVVFLWAQKTLPDTQVSDTILWIFSLVFCCACSLRLARFNLIDTTAPKLKETMKELVDYTSSEDDEYDTKKKRKSRSKFIRKMNDAMDGFITKKKFFQGVPAPIAGGLALVPLIFWLYTGETQFQGIDGRLMVITNMIFVSLLMVSKIPTLSSKMIVRDAKRETPLKTRSIASLITKIAMGCGLFYVLYVHPWEFCLFLACIYFCSLPVGVVIYYTIQEDSLANKRH